MNFSKMQARHSQNDRFTGFCQTYDMFRPKPPESIFTLSLKLTQNSKPELVVDLGCGTGLSTRPWTHLAKKIVGIDPSDDMLKIAQENTIADHIQYRKGTGERIPIEPNTTDIITCSSSVHWIDPYLLLKELDRILKPQGIFVVYGHYYPVYTDSYILTKMHENWRRNLDRLEYDEEKQVHQPYTLKTSTDAFDSSDVFAYTRKLYLHSEQQWAPQQIIGFMEAHAGVPFLRNRGYNDTQLLFTNFKKELNKFSSDYLFTVFFTYSVYFGIKKPQ